MAKTFIDAEGQSMGAKDLSFEFIILEHIRRITKLASIEWHGGRTVQRESPQQHFTLMQESFYIESTSEAYSNAVECLMDLLLPIADKELLSIEEKNNLDVQELWSNLNKWHKEATEQAQKKLPTKSIDRARSNNMRMVAKKRRDLFRAICQFMNRANFFNTNAVFEDEVTA